MEIETKIKNELLRILAEKNIDIQPEQISLKLLLNVKQY